MANPFLGTDAPNIASGWGAAPQLHAPAIGGLVGEILQNRRWQQANTQKSIADAIKEFQEQQSSKVLLQAAQNACMPQGDYSGMDAKRRL
jgi:hypothetical protein